MRGGDGADNHRVRELRRCDPVTHLPNDALRVQNGFTKLLRVKLTLC
jgi:hypothetical protein